MSKNSTLTHPLRLIQGLENTPQFKSQLSVGNRKRAMGNTARFFAEKMSQKEQPTEQELLDQFAVSLIATLPSFIDGSRHLQAIKEYKKRTGIDAPRSQKLPHLKKVVPFNHVIRGLMDKVPNSTQKNITDFCMVVGAELGGARDASYIEREVGSRIVGMQHEIALGQIVETIDGVESVKQGDINDDLNGCDLKVNYRGIEILLDAKASDGLCKEKLAEREYYRLSKRLTEADMADSGYPVFTGVSNSDFRADFRIGQETIERSAPNIEEVLLSLYSARNDQTKEA